MGSMLQPYPFTLTHPVKYNAFLCQVQFLSVSRFHRPGLVSIPIQAHPFLQELSVYSKE